MNTTERYAVVTGASSGIGWQISAELARRGYSILAVSNQPEQLDSLKQELESLYPINVSPMDLDLTEPAAAENIFDHCQNNRLPIEVLVNNDREKVNIPLAKRLGVMKEPDKVARAGVNALFQNRAECVPGLLNKCIMIIIPIVPKGLIGFIHCKTRKRQPS